MPFSSKAQQKFMFAKHPKLAEEFAEETPSFKKLPEHVKKMAQGGKVFESDGKKYTFTPGKNASLTAPAPKKPSLMDVIMAPRNPVKTIMPSPNIPKMADGGMVDDEDSDQDMDQSTTNYLKDQFEPKETTPADPGLAGPAVSPSADSRIQDSSPTHSPEDLAGYVKQQESAIDKYGPEQEKAVLDSIAKSQGSVGNRVSRGLAGLGDAIMGVAGKSGPGFLNSFENREQNQNKMAAEAIPQLQGMNEKNLAAKQALQGMTETSPLGKAKADFLTPLVQKFFPGKTPAEYQRMLQNPDAVASMIGIPADVYKGEVEAKMKANELAIQGKNAETAAQQARTAETRTEAEIENERAQRAQEEEARQLTAAQDVTKGSWIPFIGPSHAEKQAALAAESKIAQGGNQPSSPMTKIQDSHGQMHMIPTQNLSKAKQRDPGLKVIQ